MPPPDPIPPHLPKTIGLCPSEGCSGEFYMPDPRPGDKCPMNDSYGDHGETLVVYRLADDGSTVIPPAEAGSHLEAPDA